MKFNQNTLHLINNKLINIIGGDWSWGVGVAGGRVGGVGVGGVGVEGLELGGVESGWGGVRGL